jgi:hypothetical protein
LRTLRKSRITRMANNGIKGDGKKPPRLMPGVICRREGLWRWT